VDLGPKLPVEVVGGYFDCFPRPVIGLNLVAFVRHDGAKWTGIA
jgi:hypothetical protein